MVGRDWLGTAIAHGAEFVGPVAAWSTRIRGRTVGLERPLVLVMIPLAAVVLIALVRRRRGGDATEAASGQSTDGDRGTAGDRDGGDGTAPRRRRWLLVGSRLLIVTLLVIGAAGPYTVTTEETPGEPTVTMLVDRSDSMAVLADPGDLAERVEATGVPVTTVPVGDADGTGSPIGEALAANLRANGTVLVVSDGQVTTGQGLAEAGELAGSLGATVSVVELETTATERLASLNGPAKTSQGVQNTFLAGVDGSNLEGTTTRLVVTVDGEEILSREVTGTGRVEFTHAFNETGTHEVTARVEPVGGAGGDSDQFPDNDVARRSVRVVQQPRILYVSRSDYPLREYLSEVYRVDAVRQVPSNLSDSPYYAVVLQNLRADEVGNVSALQRFVVDGNGLVVAGGSRAFEHGDYRGSTLGSILPVEPGEQAGVSANLVFAIDVSGSSEAGMRVQKAVALSALEQLGPANTVGIVGFNDRAYRVADPVRVGDGRDELASRIRRLTPGGGTSLAVGLRGANDMLGGAGGTIILISDGRDRAGGVVEAASRLPTDVRVISVGTGPSPNAWLLQRVGASTGGTYLRADETSRLQILFGGSGQSYAGDSLAIIDRGSFITTGVTLRSNPPLTNDVAVKQGASYLVAAGDGRPAVASWRYGLGRVVTFTAYDQRDTLDGLLDRPDSLLVTKATNWAIGDPERRTAGVADVPDTRVDEPTTVTYRGPQRPTPPNVEFARAGDGVYRATVTPTQTGFQSILGATYAVDAHREYAAVGQSAELTRLATETGGRTFAPGDAEAIAQQARQQARRVRAVETSWSWLPIVAALLVFTLEVCVRRVQVYRGRATNESGL
jgi:hypothetical protein